MGNVENKLLLGNAPDSPQYSILLADSNMTFRQGVSSLLAFYDDYSSANYVVSGESTTVTDTLALILSQRPTLVLLESHLENSWHKTRDLLMQIQKLDPAPKVLLMADYLTSAELFEGMQAGAAGCITKNHIATTLLTAIDTMNAGNIYFNQSLINDLFYWFQSRAQQRLEKYQHLRLSKREQEVLKALAGGESNDAIAKDLYISTATVKAHCTSIFEKLGVKSRTQAIIQAFRLGLV